MRDSNRDTDMKNSLLDSVGEGKGGMIWENSIETCLLPYSDASMEPEVFLFLFTIQFMALKKIGGRLVNTHWTPETMSGPPPWRSSLPDC